MRTLRQKPDGLIDSVLAAFFLFAILLMSVPLAASQGDRGFELVEPRQGSPIGDVRAIVQDADGFIWLGGYQGLYRYDGHESVLFERGAPHGPDSNQITDLLIDSDGFMWVGTDGGGLSRFDPRTELFVTFRHNPEDSSSLAGDYIHDLVEDKDGRIWISTDRGGLSRLDDKDSVAGPFTRFRHLVGDENSLADNRTRQLLIDRRGQLWVATLSGIDRMVGEDPPTFLHYRHDESRPSSLLDDEVWALLEDSSGVLWAGSWGGGIARLVNVNADPEDAEFETFMPSGDPGSLSDKRVMNIFEDSAGTLWIGTLGGLNELRPEERHARSPRFRRHLNDPLWTHSLPALHITAFYEDSERDLWIGTRGGVSRLDRSLEPFSTFRRQIGLDSSIGAEPIHAMTDDRGAVWVGHRQGVDRLLLSNDGSELLEITHFMSAHEGAHEGTGPVFPGDRVVESIQDRFGFIWFATYLGLVGIRPDQIAHDEPDFLFFSDELSSDAVLTLYEDPSGTLWVGTYRGLHHVVRDPSGFPIDFPVYAHDADDPTSLSSSAVSAITAGVNGELWVGTYHGLNRFDPVSGSAERFLPNASDPYSLGHAHIESLEVDRDGRLWIATRGDGLNLYLGGDRFESVMRSDGMPSDTVGAIRSGTSGDLWGATANGLARANPATGEIEIFEEVSGLGSSEVNSVEVAANGRVLVATSSGVTLFHPDDLKISDFVAPIALTRLLVLNQTVAAGPESILESAINFADRIELEHTDYMVGFEFAALSYRQTRKPTYRYRLSGLDDEWIHTDWKDRRAVYSTLPPGKYRFEVQATIRDGLWSETAAGLEVRVLPPWWMTWWARALAISGVLLIAISWPLLRLKRARTLNELLEDRVLERTQELAEANLKLERASHTDTLTRLPNRRHFLVRAETEIVTYHRTGRPLSLAIADIDDFKKINDTWGHECGDQVLRQVAQLIRDELREVDLVARWGGEEFILLFPETESEGAVTVADKVRRRVADNCFLWQEQEIPVTLTIGLAQIAPGDGIADTRSRADEALYLGKRRGKNRVEALDGARRAQPRVEAVRLA